MKTIHINTSSKKYDIFVGNGILDNSGSIIKSLNFSGKILIVTDDIVSELYLETVKNSLENCGFSVCDVVLPHGEEHKNMDSIMKIYDVLQKNGLNRKSLIVALGGGVIGDMSGFAAATYLRGIKYIQIPTTLLAQVDSSIGGKTGIDLPFGKNLVGAFYQPEAVIADVGALKTLSQENISCGMAEVIKSAFIKDETFVDKLENSTNFNQDIEEFIIRSMNIKKEVVEFDEFEKHERMKLNFGHTLGHALEKKLNFKGITHGQAVAIGMCLITHNPVVKAKLLKILNKYNLDSKTEFSAKDLVSGAFNDKKAEDDGINIVVVNKIGDAEIKKISFEEFCKLYE